MEYLVSFVSNHFLSVIIFLPLVAACALMLVPQVKDDSERDKTLLAIAFPFSLLIFVLGCVLVSDFETDAALQFVERAAWIPALGVHYVVGVDGVSVFLVLLTVFLMPLIVLSSSSVQKNLRGYLISMFVLESAMLGALTALDGLLFYVFWEFMLAPMYFLIGIWGGKRRIYASLKFVLYTAVGSVLMLVALLYVVAAHAEQTGVVSFLIGDLLNTELTFNEELWLFGAFALAFGIKVPIFPFHTWLPDAHVEAPTGGSVVLAGILLKMGIYGFLRFAYPLFPRAAEAFGPLLGGLAVFGIVYGALVAWVQPDIKKLIAYSSVSHLGYCVLGLVALNEIATTGAVFQMVSHGITTGALFLLVGVLYDRKHTRLISDYGGLARKVPVFSFLFVTFTLGSIALPLTVGFVGEFLILFGSFLRYPLLTFCALAGVVLGAVYMLTLVLKTLFGELSEEKNGDLTDVTPRELVTFAPLLVLVFVLGVYPKPMLDRMEPSVKAYLENMSKRRHELALAESEREGSVEVTPYEVALTEKNEELAIEEL